MANSNPLPRRAVIDLGTNTFHLLIAEVSPGVVTTLYRERRFVKLAQDGIERIGPEPFERGISTLTHFRKVLDEYEIGPVFAFGTAALRTAVNGLEFVQAARRIGIDVTLIPGDEEARLITRGVLGALPPLNEKVLIMDIGGGSTEFIIADQSRVYWRRSFPIGVLVLFNQFRPSDPLTDAEHDALWAYLHDVLHPLAEALTRQRTTRHLVGAAGTFDVLVDLFATDVGPDNRAPHHALDLTKLDAFYRTMRASTLAERLADPTIPEQRAELMVVAMILIQFTLTLVQPERVTVSEWSMKEGILLESLENDHA